MKARTGDELWQTIMKFSFDDPLGDAIERGERRTFEAEKLGGIHEVSRYIYDNWTVEELDFFIMAWNATPCGDKETAMGAPQKPIDRKDIAAWNKWKTEGARAARRVQNLDCALHAIQQSALLAIGANCYADCKRDDARIAFSLDAKPYFGMTLTTLERTLPPPLVGMLQAIGANARRGADAAESAQAAAEKAAEDSETAGRLVLNHLTPRPGDYEVKQKQLSEILGRLNAKVTIKTIQRWEAYLKKGGKQGTKQPEGYTLETRRTLAGATTWAEKYAAREKSKLNTKVSLDRLTGGRR